MGKDFFLGGIMVVVVVRLRCVQHIGAYGVLHTELLEINDTELVFFQSVASNHPSTDTLHGNPSLGCAAPSKT